MKKKLDRVAMRHLMRLALKSPGGRIVLEHNFIVVAEFTEKKDYSIVSCGNVHTYRIMSDWDTAVDVLFKEAEKPDIAVYVHVPGLFTFQQGGLHFPSILNEIKRRTVIVTSTPLNTNNIKQLVDCMKLARAAGVDKCNPIMVKASNAIRDAICL